MLEFILGLIIGVLGLWFAAHEKLRYDIYREKLEVYKRLQGIAADALLCVVPPQETSGLKEKYLQNTTSLMFELHQNAIFIADEVFSRGFDIWFSDFDDIGKDKQDFYKKYDHFINSMREDLKVKSLHKISTFIIDKPNIKTEKVNKILSKTAEIIVKSHLTI